METITQAIYFIGAVFITMANPFLTILLIASTIFDKQLMGILYQQFIIGATSFCTVSFYAMPVVFLIYIIARYLK
jgi:hypothetical protein